MHATTFLATLLSLAAVGQSAPTSQTATEQKWANPIPAPEGFDARSAPAHPLGNAINKRQGFVGGWCGVHVRGIDVFDGENKGQRRGTVKIFDGEGWLSWASEEVSSEGGAVQIDGQEGGMPERLWTTIFPEGVNNDIVSTTMSLTTRTLLDVVTLTSIPQARFSYGDHRWASGKANSEQFDDGGVLICKVGKFDSGNGLLPKNQKVDLDCGFSC